MKFTFFTDSSNPTAGNSYIRAVQFTPRVNMKIEKISVNQILLDSSSVYKNYEFIAVLVVQDTIANYVPGSVQSVNNYISSHGNNNKNAKILGPVLFKSGTSITLRTITYSTLLATDILNIYWQILYSEY